MIAIFPELLAAVKRDDIEALALGCRKYFAGVHASKPTLNVQALFPVLGIDLQYSKVVNEASIVGKDEAGAMSVAVILPARMNVADEESSFCLAHALGHFFFDIQVLMARGEFHRSGFKERESARSRYVSGKSQFLGRELKIEMRADEFAAALLLPRMMIEKAVPKLLTIEKLCSFFGVTEELLSARLNKIKAQTNPADSKPVIKGSGGLSRIRALAKSLER